ncbi:hypothetical protein M422DRAFT_241715 [Sphaerobolus stellatus SS14]|nr:hypothetical protein M422DRAFT_241715 [Sphaerobolus stellatus SS14]
MQTLETAGPAKRNQDTRTQSCGNSVRPLRWLRNFRVTSRKYLEGRIWCSLVTIEAKKPSIISQFLNIELNQRNPAISKEKKATRVLSYQLGLAPPADTLVTLIRKVSTIWLWLFLSIKNIVRMAKNWSST